MALQITLYLDLHPLIIQALKTYSDSLNNNFDSSVLINTAQDLIEDAVRNCRFKEASDLALSVDQLMKNLSSLSYKVALI